MTSIDSHEENFIFTCRGNGALLSWGSSPSTSVGMAESEGTFMSPAALVLMVINFAGYSASTNFDCVMEKTEFNPVQTP